MLSSTVEAVVNNHQLQAIFRHFPFADIQDRSPSLFIPLPLPYLNDPSGNTEYQLGIIPLELGFWITAFVLLCGQALLNTVVALVTYDYLLPTRPNHFLLGYGIVVPTLLAFPLALFRYWRCPNISLMICLAGALPNILALRVVQAMHGKLPTYCQNNRKMLCLYFASTLLLSFEDGKPVLFTRRLLWQKFGHFVSVFVQTSLLLSLLLSTTITSTKYQVFPSSPTNNIFYWGNLGNAFLLASLTSLVLDGGCSGLGILTSCLTGYSLEQFSDAPLTQSTSPSDFWGRRWDRPVQSALRGGCYEPLRDSCSSAVAAFGTFVVSGCIHEYVLWTMSYRGGEHHVYQPRYGRQFVFFLWNGLVLLLERYWRQWTQSYAKTLQQIPRPLQTTFVLMTVLPIAHFFTDEYVLASFYDDASWGFPILKVIVVQR